MTEASTAVFLSYASQDAEAARRIRDALRAAGIEVWFDQSELRGGDAWDQQIRRQIKDCSLFVPVISAHTQARTEGYFRLEWHLADQRKLLMTRNRPFLLPVCIDGTLDADAEVPDSFSAVQWTRLPDGETTREFAERVLGLLSPKAVPAPTDVRSPPAAATRQVAASPQYAPTPSSWTRRVPLMIVALAVIGVGYIALDRFVRSKRPAAGGHTSAPFGPSTPPAQSVIPEKSVAVLPFADMSEKHDQEYFSDGLSEEILNLLATIPSLSVIGRTSSFQFKGRSDDLRAIGAQLGAAYVLEGSVRTSGEHVRVVAQLVSTRDGVRRWSNTYDRPLGDVLKLQDELAAGVARALEVTVASDAVLSRQASTNPEAYDLYLRGLHSLDRRNREGFEAAANYFQQALDLDGRFTAAATQLGRTLVYQAEFGFGPVAETYERARHSLDIAIRLDPNFGVAHAWLGWVRMAYDWDWLAADDEMTHALRLAPRDPLVLLCAARLAEAVGHWDDAIRLMTASLAREPLSPGANNVFSGIYARAGRLEEAESAERKTLEISPTYSTAPYNLAILLLTLGRSQEALSVAQRTTYRRASALALIYHALGRNAESDAQLVTLAREHSDSAAFNIAEVHAYRGELDEAFRWLDRAYKQKDPSLYLLKGDLLLRKLEPDARYKSFLRKMNLPE